MALSRRLIGLASVALLPLVACSRYYSNDPPVDAGTGETDAAIESAPSDAGTDPTDAADASDADGGGGADCAPNFTEDFSSTAFPPAGWVVSLSTDGNPTLALANAQLASSVELTTTGVSGKAEISRDLFLSPTSYALDYDLGLGTLTGLYVELGCTLILYDVNGDATTILLSLDDGKLALDGAADTVTVTAPAMVLGAVASGASYHVRLDGTVTPTSVTTTAHVTSAGSAFTNAQALPLAGMTTKLKIKCGIRYAALPLSRVGGAFPITIDNVALAACP